MFLDLDLSDRPVWVLGDADGTARVVRRLRYAGALVTQLSDPAAGPASPSPVLIVRVGTDPRWDSLVERTASALSVLLPTPAQGGHIVLVGGGPGDTRLLTRAAEEALADCDAVLVDRLAPVEHLRELTGGAEIVDVGKTPGHHPWSQDAINDELVRRGKAGQVVVRLKGGDPFVFGRGGEEVAACVAAGVPVSYLPGVTSATAVPGIAGVPVTHRNTSRAFTVISGHAPLTEPECAGLVALGGTIVILMGVATLHQSAASLVRAGLPARTPVAVIERGFAADQRVTRAPLSEIGARAAAVGVTSPAVIVIGETADLSEVAQVVPAETLR